MGFKVEVFVYDLSQGMARQMSPALLGKQIDGIWHTGVQVYGTEYYFGGGICQCPAEMSPYGRPVQGIKMHVILDPIDLLAANAPNQSLMHAALHTCSPSNGADQQDPGRVPRLFGIDIFSLHGIHIQPLGE